MQFFSDQIIALISNSNIEQTMKKVKATIRYKVPVEIRKKKSTKDGIRCKQISSA